MQFKNTDELKAALRGHIGTTQYHRNGFCLPHTDGVADLIEIAACHWWISDMSVVARMKPKVRAHDFQVWKLVVKGGKATSYIEDGNDNLLYKQKYSMTDFPEGEFSVWVEGGIIILPSEH
jgi:hypothetical protein